MSRGDTVEKNILERDCHFVSGKPAATCDKHNIDWVPSLNLGKMEFKGDEQKEQKQRASDERAERSKERSKGAIEWQELKVAQKRKHVNVSSGGIVDIHLAETNTSASTEDVEEDTGLAVANMPEMELAEPSCSTSLSTSNVENQAKGRTPEILKDTEKTDQGVRLSRQRVFQVR